MFRLKEKDMRAFVTGGTGLLGSNLIRELVGQGHTVRALARSAEKARRLLPDVPVEWVVGDMEDAAPTTAGQIVLDFLRQKVPGILEGGTSIADPRDVAKAMVRIAEVGRPRERYLASGPYADFATLFRELEAVSGVKGPRLRIP